MPNIPNVPGVPPLTSFATTALTLLAADVVSPLVGVSAPTWGIFLNGENVIDAESMASFALKQDNPVSDYAVEQGSFATYNKVQLPVMIRVVMQQGGSEADRSAFLASITAVMNTTDIYDVVTPEETYVGYNFSHRDFSRSARNGVGLIQVELVLVQIRETSTSTFQNTQNPSDAGQVGNGAAQPQEPSQFISQNFEAGVWAPQ